MKLLENNTRYIKGSFISKSVLYNVLFCKPKLDFATSMLIINFSTPFLWAFSTYFFLYFSIIKCPICQTVNLEATLNYKLFSIQFWTIKVKCNFL